MGEILSFKSNKSTKKYSEQLLIDRLNLLTARLQQLEAESLNCAVEANFLLPQYFEITIAMADDGRLMERMFPQIEMNFE